MTEKFSNVIQVVEYLNDNGCRISKSAVYNHVNAGRLAKGKDGYFWLDTVKKYAASLADGLSTSVLDPSIQTEAQTADEQWRIARANLYVTKDKILRDKYVEREWAERQLSARVMVLRSDFENFFRSMTPAIIAKADGKIEFAPDVIEFLLIEFEKMLGRYSEPIEFKTADESAQDEN